MISWRNVSYWANSKWRCYVRRPRRYYVQNQIFVRFMHLWQYKLTRLLKSRFVVISMVNSMIFENYLLWVVNVQERITCSWEIMLIEDITVWRHAYCCCVWRYVILTVSHSCEAIMRVVRSVKCMVSMMIVFVNMVLSIPGDIVWKYSTVWPYVR